MNLQAIRWYPQYPLIHFLEVFLQSWWTGYHKLCVMLKKYKTTNDLLFFPLLFKINPEYICKTEEISFFYFLWSTECIVGSEDWRYSCIRKNRTETLLVNYLALKFCCTILWLGHLTSTTKIKEETLLLLVKTLTRSSFEICQMHIRAKVYE